MNREIRNTVGNAEATLQEKSMVTDITPAHVVALQASLWAGYQRKGKLNKAQERVRSEA